MFNVYYLYKIGERIKNRLFMVGGWMSEQDLFQDLWNNFLGFCKF